MADLKSIANMQIGGPKYPKKRRINLYQKQVKKGKIAAELGVFVVFMGLVYGFSQFDVVRLLRKADQAEAVYAATEQQLSALQKSNEVYSEVQAEYAHYGNGYLNEEERQLPDRRKMLDSLKSQIFPLTAVSTVSITSDQMALEGRIPNGSSFSRCGGGSGCTLCDGVSGRDGSERGGGAGSCGFQTGGRVDDCIF